MGVIMLDMMICYGRSAIGCIFSKPAREQQQQQHWRLTGEDTVNKPLILLQSF